MQKSVLRPACLGDERKSRRTTPICVKKTTFRVQQYVRVQDVLHCQVCGSDGCLGSSPVAAEVLQVAIRKARQSGYEHMVPASSYGGSGGSTSRSRKTPTPSRTQLNVVR